MYPNDQPQADTLPIASPFASSGKNAAAMFSPVPKKTFDKHDERERERQISGADQGQERRAEHAARRSDREQFLSCGVSVGISADDRSGEDDDRVAHDNANVHANVPQLCPAQTTPTK